MDRVVDNINNGHSQIEEYEQNLLGLVLSRPEWIKEIDSFLDCTDFYSEKHCSIYKAMLDMNDSNIPIDVLTLRNFLEKQHQLEQAGTSTYLTYLSAVVISGSDLDYYANEIKTASYNRKRWEKCHHIIEAIEKGEGLAIIEENIQSLLEIPSAALAKNPLKPISAKDLKNVPAPESIWADILFPKCITQINSEPGIGKSTIAYNIAALGALEQPFLGMYFSKKIKTLNVDLETPPNIRGRKIERICGVLPENFYILENLDLKKQFKDFHSLCIKEKYDLLILDTQSRTLGMEQENDNSEANYLMGLLRRIANESGCAILLIHHTAKGETARAVYKGRGASAIAAAVDIVANLELLDSNTLKLKVEKSRIYGVNRTLIIRKLGEDKFELKETSLNEDSKSTQELHLIQELIVELMTISSKPLRTAEILEEAERKGFRTRTVEDALSRLCESGKIEKRRQGLYEISEIPISATSADPMSYGTAETVETDKIDGSGGLK